MKILKKKRSFIVGEKIKIKIFHVADIKLRTNQQVTFLFKKSQFDFTKKNWGFYVTPSINGRLVEQGFKTAIVKNKYKKIYIMSVHKKKLVDFKKYCKDHDQKVIKWLSD